jgi:hypothetical protein
MAAIGKFKALLHAPIVPLLLYVFEANSFFQMSLIYAPTAGRTIALRRHVDAPARRNDEDGPVVAYAGKSPAER